MALTKCSVSTDVIGTLGTTVEERGITTQQFKDKFDEMPEGIKTYLNDTLTAEIDTALAAAESEINTGWNPANETWTYASAATFTVASDVRTKYQKGDKFKLTSNGTVLYGYILSVTYSAPNSTVTVVGNALTNFAYTNNYFSKASTPQDFPHWFAWTDNLTWTTATPTLSTDVARYAIVGNMCYPHVYLVTLNGLGATALKISVPVTPKNNNDTVPLLATQMVNSVYSIPMPYIDTTTTDGIKFFNLSTLTNGVASVISISGAYEI
jgi:hypothetical protein